MGLLIWLLGLLGFLAFFGFLATWLLGFGFTMSFRISHTRDRLEGRRIWNYSGTTWHDDEHVLFPKQRLRLGLLLRFNRICFGFPGMLVGSLAPPSPDHDLFRLSPTTTSPD